MKSVAYLPPPTVPNLVRKNYQVSVVAFPVDYDATKIIRINQSSQKSYGINYFLAFRELKELKDGYRYIKE